MSKRVCENGRSDLLAGACLAQLLQLVPVINQVLQARRHFVCADGRLGYQLLSFLLQSLVTNSQQMVRELRHNNDYIWRDGYIANLYGVLLGRELLLKSLVFLPQVLHTSQVFTKVLTRNQNLLLLDPAVFVVQLTEELLQTVRLRQLGAPNRRQLLQLHRDNLSAMASAGGIDRW